VLISDSNITTLEAESVDSTTLVGGAKQKTASQRLRAVLFILSTLNNNDNNFDYFYKQEMEKFISSVKYKIDELQNV